MMLTLFQLFWSFCKIGFTSFGGLSMIPLISDEMVRHHWMTYSEVSDIVAVAEMTPGPLGLNCATFAGMRVAGIPGAMITNLGIMFPTFTICAVAALLFEHFKKSQITKNIMVGVRPVSIGIILAVLISLGSTNYYPDGAVAVRSILIGLLMLFLLLKKKVSIPIIIALSAVLGLLIT